MVLIVSILGPPISKWYNSDLQAIVMMDTSEEDKSGKTENDVEEKMLQNITAHVKVLFFIPKKIGYDHYLDTDSNYVSKIVLPPPKHRV
jgi:hypothetical protein